MLLHQLELMRQLLQDALLLGGKILSLLETMQHLDLLRGEIERRPDRLLAGLESLGRYRIVVALDWIGRWGSSCGLLKVVMKRLENFARAKFLSRDGKRF